MDFKIIWKQSPNFKSGRNGKKIIAIVNHITAGLMPGTLSWLCNPQAKASAHYLVCKDGSIYQLVKDTDTAYHAGIVNKPNWSLYDGTNPNRYTIGIEFECKSGGELTEIQYQAGLWLHKQLISKYNIPVDSNHIIGHYRIDSVNRPNDPGVNFPWQRLFNDLSEKDPQYIQALQHLVNKKLITSYDYWLNTNGDFNGLYAGILINRIAGKPDDLSNLDESLNFLVNKGILSSPDYWRNNCKQGELVKGSYMKLLIMKCVANLGL